MKNKTSVEVDLKLKFDNVRQVERLVDLLRKLDCPMKDVEKCEFCLYHESCLKLREIIMNKIEFALSQEGE